MEHLSDLPFNEGVDGTRRAINFLRDLRDMLAGHNTSQVRATVKYDGSPAVFAGIDPTDKKFFVATKGLFNKSPKLYKTQADIDANLQGDLNTKMSLALSEFKKLGIKSGIYQGDIMFTKDTLKATTIDGESYITFHPNTIIYAIPATSSDAIRVRRAKIGVVWHTIYSGNDLANMNASFGLPILNKFNDVPTIWQVDAVYQDYSGSASFTKSETAEITSVLSEIGKLFNTINGRALDAISHNNDFLILVKTYNNLKIRNSENITDPIAHAKGLYTYIYDRLKAEVDALKTDKGKAQRSEKLQSILGWFRTYDVEELIKIYKLTIMLTNAKHMIVDKMNYASMMKHFVKTTSGFKTVSPEGYVAIDHLGTNAVKLVNRMEFSRNNFDPEILKGWMR